MLVVPRAGNQDTWAENDGAKPQRSFLLHRLENGSNPGNQSQMKTTLPFVIREERTSGAEARIFVDTLRPTKVVP
jgi:hypothetical protein